MSQRHNVHLNHLQLALDIGLGEFSTESEAGVVDENLNWNILIAQEIEERFRRLASAEVGGEDVHLHVVLAFDLTGCSF